MNQRFQRFVIDDVEVWHIDADQQQHLLDLFAYAATAIVMTHTESATFRFSNPSNTAKQEREGFILHLRRCEDQGRIYLQGDFRKPGQRLRVQGHFERICD